MALHAEERREAGRDLLLVDTAERHAAAELERGLERRHDGTVRSDLESEHFGGSAGARAARR